jgi:hypothetical protein
LTAAPKAFFFPAQAATTLASLWPGAGGTSASEIAELLAATDRVVAECRGVEEATVMSGRGMSRAPCCRSQKFDPVGFAL